MPLRADRITLHRRPVLEPEYRQRNAWKVRNCSMGAGGVTGMDQFHRSPSLQNLTGRLIDRELATPRARLRSLYSCKNGILES
jgi:hypothetical protein